jgi:hypothetical protein
MRTREVTPRVVGGRGEGEVVRNSGRGGSAESGGERRRRRGKNAHPKEKEGAFPLEKGLIPMLMGFGTPLRVIPFLSLRLSLRLGRGRNPLDLEGGAFSLQKEGRIRGR